MGLISRKEKILALVLIATFIVVIPAEIVTTIVRTRVLWGITNGKNKSSPAAISFDGLSRCLKRGIGFYAVNLYRVAAKRSVRIDCRQTRQ
jgi:hypothetical protein